MIITKCKKCVFALSENNTQTGCSLNIPSSIIEEYPQTYTQETQRVVDGYYELHNFYCPYARTAEWKDAILRNKLDIETAIYNETKIRYNLIMLIDDETIDNLFSNLLESFGGSCPPSYISLITRNIKDNDIQRIIGFVNKIERVCPWKLFNILDNEMTHSETIDFCLENNLLLDKYNLLMIINNKYKISNGFMESTNNIVNSFIEKQAVIIPKDLFSFTNIVIPTQLYQAMQNKIGLALDYLDRDESNSVYKFCVE